MFETSLRNLAVYCELVSKWTDRLTDREITRDVYIQCHLGSIFSMRVGMWDLANECSHNFT